MALRNQPYLPLYIQDIMTDEKLNECSASTHGIYIKGIMCLMHKSDEYGKILLKQKYKQTEKQSKNFALQLAKHLPYSVDEIDEAITELIRENVCFFDGDYICQKRMIKDNYISEQRALSGSKGGKNTVKNIQKFAKAKDEAKQPANSEYEIENEIINEFEIFWNLYNKKIGDKDKLFKKWKLLKKEDKEKIFIHIPKYIESQPDKKFRKNPETYLNNKSWNDEIINTKDSNFLNPDVPGHLRGCSNFDE